MARISLASGVFISFLDDGSVNAGGTLTVYNAGTTTLSTFYNQQTGGSASSNPLTLDAAGRGKVWLTDDKLYDVVVKDSSGNTIYSEDGLGQKTLDTATSNWNYPCNPSFEELDDADNTAPANWTLVRTDGVVVDTSDTHHGKYSLKFTNSGSGGGTATSCKFPVTVDRNLDAYILHKFSGATVGSHVYLEWFQGDKTTSAGADTDIYNATSGNPTSWQEDSKTGITPVSGAKWAHVVIDGATSAGASGTYYIDGIKIVDAGTTSGITSVTKTGNYTVLTSDAGKFIYCDTSGGNIVITMPALASAGDGFQITVVKTAAANSVKVQDSGATEIRTFYGNNDYLELTANGTSSWTVSNEHVSIPAFLVVKQSDQTVGTSGAKITWDSETYDKAGNFASNKFTAPFNGLYKLGWRMNTDQNVRVRMYVNGADVNYHDSDGGAGTTANSPPILYELSTNDYVELYAFASTGTLDVLGDTSDNYTWWWGHLVQRLP